METHEGRRLVVGYDASPGSERALGWAVQRAGATGRVLVVHGAKRQTDRLALPTPRVGESARAALAEAVVDVPFLERDDLFQGVDCDSQARNASPANALMQIAEELDAHAIVVGTRHRGRLRATTGSVCADLLEHSPRPIVIVP
jgi:nucleotide-binding universal stress UspA family protein